MIITRTEEREGEIEIGRTDDWTGAGDGQRRTATDSDLADASADRDNRNESHVTRPTPTEHGERDKPTNNNQWNQWSNRDPATLSTEVSVSCGKRHKEEQEMRKRRGRGRRRNESLTAPATGTLYRRPMRESGGYAAVSISTPRCVRPSGRQPRASQPTKRTAIPRDATSRLTTALTTLVGGDRSQESNKGRHRRR